MPAIGSSTIPRYLDRGIRKSPVAFYQRSSVNAGAAYYPVVVGLDPAIHCQAMVHGCVRAHRTALGRGDPRSNYKQESLVAPFVIMSKLEISPSLPLFGAQFLPLDPGGS